MDAEEQPIEAPEPPAPEPALPRLPPEPVTPPQSRFLYVDVAALRAKQLRRGALPRIDPATLPAPVGAHADALHKPERVAMEEVRQGLVVYTIPGEDEAEPSSDASDADA